jgi:hypothetical protein
MRWHEPHVRFCEGLGVTYPGLTRQSRRFLRVHATSDYPPKLTGMLLFSVRGLPDNILLVEKGPNGGVGPSHLGVRKTAMLATRDGHELVAYSRFDSVSKEQLDLRLLGSK